jgi:putative lipoprotein
MMTELRFFMRLLSFLLLSSSLLFNAACVSPTSTVSPPPDKITVIKEDFSTILDSNFRGYFSFTDGKGYFTTCDSGQDFPVIVNAALTNIYQQITPEKSTPVYIEFVGEITFPAINTPPSDPLMRIDRVHHMALPKASLQCAKATTGFLFKAKGEDPYWRLNIDQDKLHFATQAGNRAYKIQDSNFNSTQTNYIKTNNEQGERLSLRIQPGHCYNLKMKEYWGLTAKVDSVWGEFSGCGEAGWPIDYHDFAGYYLNITPSKTTNLTLKSNYRVEYKENIGEEAITKTGFWKSNSPDRVVVMLTQQGMQKIQEELIFKRSDATLRSTKLNKNNIIIRIPPSERLFNKMTSKEISSKNTTNRIEREFTVQHIDPKTEIDKALQKALNQYFKIHRTDPKGTKFSSVNYDLNGDGLNEAIVLLDWCSKGGCEMLIFERQGGDYRFSSRISQIQVPVIVSSNQHYLWQSLLVEKDKKWLILDFDGISYPSHTRTLTVVNKLDVATDIILFSQGRPKNWFPIKMQ